MRRIKCLFVQMYDMQDLFAGNCACLQEENIFGSLGNVQFHIRIGGSGRPVNVLL